MKTFLPHEKRTVVVTCKTPKILEYIIRDLKIWGREGQDGNGSVRGKLTHFRLVAKECLFIWKRAVPGRRVTLSPGPSFAKRLDEKNYFVERDKTWPSRFKRLARVVVKLLLWLLFLKSGTLDRRPRPFLNKFTVYFDFNLSAILCFADFGVCACSVCAYLSLVGKAKITKLFIWLAPQGHPTFKASDPPPRATLPPEPTLQFLM